MSGAGVRLHSLDALRGAAALSVVCWHWQHFQLLGTARLTWPPVSGHIDYAREPFYPLLRLFYERGFEAVDLFFVISGFIFFWLYQAKLASRALSLRDFAALRFSRLYPLHILTLLMVAAMQFAHHHLTGQFFVYSANDPLHFVMQLLFLQDLDPNASFNGPTWSLSVEVFMYGLFCVLAWLGALRSAIAPIVLIAVGMLLHATSSDLARGMCGYFAGGAAYRLFERLNGSARRRTYLSLFAIVCAMGWGVVLLDTYTDRSVSAAAAAALPANWLRLFSYAYLYGLAPATVVTLSLHENSSGHRYANLAWLGEISYSTYLLHFPMQLALALLVAVGLVDVAAARSGPAMILFFAVLIAVSLFAFRAFEAPAQTKLRSLLIRRRPMAADGSLGPHTN